MLLPKNDEDEDDEDLGDPRAELVQRLIEYQKFKSAAGELHDLQRLNRDNFERIPLNIGIVPTEDLPLKEVGVFALIKAFDGILKRQKPEVRHRVMLENVSVKKRIISMIEFLVGKESVPFEDALGSISRKIDVVVTFLSILELAKLRLLKIYLSEAGHLYLQPRFAEAETALSKLHGLDHTLDGGHAVEGAG